VLTRGGTRRIGAATSALTALWSLAAGAGCAVDDLSRLGAGSAALGAGAAASADAGSALLADHLREGRPSDLELASPADAGADAASSAPVPPELLPNPGFENGHAGWMGFGNSRIIDAADAHSGSRSILSTNRQWTWEGPGYDIRSLVVTGKAYAVSAWVRNEFGSDSIILTLKTQCSGEETYTRLATRAVGAQWMSIDASFFAPACAPSEVLDELVIYVEGPAANKNLLVDDVSLRAAPIAPGASASATANASASASATDDDDQGEDEDN